jgi:hypothetical protein
VWNWDEAHVNEVSGEFDQNFYPEFDYEAANAVHPGLCSIDNQYDADMIKLFSTAFSTYRYRDGYAAAIEIAHGVALRYAGPYRASEGQHERGYSGARAAEDMVSIMKEVHAGHVIGPMYEAPFPVCKLNGRLGVPKQPTGSRWCLNGSAPYGDSVNWYCPARFQVYVPLSSDRRVTALMAAGSQRMGRGQRFQAGTDDWDNAYKTIAVALRDLWLCVFRVWCPVENRFLYFVVKRCNFGMVGSGNSFGRIAVHIVWVLCVLGFIIECWVDDLIYLGSTKQIAAGQRAADMLAELYGFFWKLPKRVGPSDVVRWIGFLFDLPNQQMRLTPEFLAKMRAFIDATNWVSRTSQRVAALQSLLGLIGRAARAIRNGLLHCYHLRRALRTAHGDWVHISPEARAEVLWFRDIAARWDGVRTFPLAPALRPTAPAGQSDSCEASMGGIWWDELAQAYRYFFHEWRSARSAHWDMIAKEALAVAAFIVLYGRRQRLRALAIPAYLVQTDSLVTAQCWTSQRTGKAEGVAHAMLALDDATTVFDVDTYVHVEHIAGVSNVLADPVSRAQWDKLQHLTHPFPLIREQIPAAWMTRWL